MALAQAPTEAAEELRRALFSRLYVENKRPLHTFFRRRGVPASDCDDLVQASFARALKVQDWAAWQGPRFYLFAVAASVVADYRRRSRTQRLFLKQMNLLCDRYEPITPEHQTEAKDDLARCLTVISALPPATRFVFIARRLEDTPFAEIAERQGKTISGMEKNLAAARRRLDLDFGAFAPIARARSHYPYPPHADAWPHTYRFPSALE